MEISTIVIKKSPQKNHEKSYIWRNFVFNILSIVQDLPGINGMEGGNCETKGDGFSLYVRRIELWHKSFKMLFILRLFLK